MTPTPLIPNRDPQAGSDLRLDAMFAETFRLAQQGPVRVEMVTSPPDRGALFVPPKPQNPPLDPATKSRLILALLAVVMIAAGLIATFQNPPRLTVSIPSMQQTPIAQPLSITQPTPAPGWNADGTGYGRAGVIGRRALTPAPRATLVKLPPPRAQFVAPPVGWQGRIHMPSNGPDEKTWVYYTGAVSDYASLPPAEFPGDMRLTRDTGAFWIWARPSGTTAYQWVDPPLNFDR
jgi:hypothetical protein